MRRGVGCAASGRQTRHRGGRGSREPRGGKVGSGRGAGRGGTSGWRWPRSSRPRGPPGASRGGMRVAWRQGCAIARGAAPVCGARPRRGAMGCDGARGQDPRGSRPTPPAAHGTPRTASAHHDARRAAPRDKASPRPSPSPHAVAITKPTPLPHLGPRGLPAMLEHVAPAMRTPQGPGPLVHREGRGGRGGGRMDTGSGSRRLSWGLAGAGGMVVAGDGAGPLPLLPHLYPGSVSQHPTPSPPHPTQIPPPHRSVSERSSQMYLGAFQNSL